MYHYNTFILTESCFEENIVYFDNDLETKLDAEDHFECQQLCQVNEKCEFWTWQTSKKKCYLKDKKNPQPRDERISGPKECPKIDSTIKQCGTLSVVSEQLGLRLKQTQCDNMNNFICESSNFAPFFQYF